MPNFRLCLQMEGWKSEGVHHPRWSRRCTHTPALLLCSHRAGTLSSVAGLNPRGRRFLYHPLPSQESSRLDRGNTRRGLHARATLIVGRFTFIVWSCFGSRKAEHSAKLRGAVVVECTGALHRIRKLRSNRSLLGRAGDSGRNTRLRLARRSQPTSGTARVVFHSALRRMLC